MSAMTELATRAFPWAAPRRELLLLVLVAVATLTPLAVVTPHGEWEECSVDLPGFGKPTVRERKAKAAWLRRIRRLMRAYPACLAVGVDYHW